MPVAMLTAVSTLTVIFAFHAELGASINLRVGSGGGMRTTVVLQRRVFRPK